MGKRRTVEGFVLDALDIHNGKYSYGKVSYRNSQTKVIITCEEHGDFACSPGNHLQGKGCKHCGMITSRKKYHKEPTTLYYVKFYPKGLPPVYKIGITKHSVKARYRGEAIPYKVIAEVRYLTGRDAYMKEQEILSQYKDCLYEGPRLFKWSSNSEVFSTNVLNLKES